MKQRYRISTINQVPNDLKERIASIHALAILSLKNVNAAEHEQGLNNPNRTAQLFREPLKNQDTNYA